MSSFVGMVLWIVAGGAVWIIARFVPPGRGAVIEAVAALVISIIAGAAATALDFGGWNEPDWRAAAFAFLCAAAAVALVRLFALRAAR
jgi:hypothetical protein